MPKKKVNKYLKAWNQAVKNVGITFEKGEFNKLPKKGTKKYGEIKREYNKLLKKMR
jgi:hypothetical protein